MPLPAARDRRIMWLVAALATLLALAPVAGLAQDAPTPIPPQSGVIDVSKATSGQIVVSDSPAVAPDVCPPNVASEAEAPYYDYLILLDVSRSMRGMRGEPEKYVPELDIWPEVATSATRFINELDDQAAVYIVPFAGGVLDPTTGLLLDPMDPAIDPATSSIISPYYMSEPGSREAATGYINSLYADYQWTHLSESVDYALRLLASLKADDNDQREHVQTLLIFSDGLGNGPGDPEYPGADANSYPTLPEILRKYLDEENYIFTKYILLSEAANGLSPELTDELIGVGVSIVNGKVPQIRELRLAVAPPELGTLDVEANDRATGRLCIVAGDPGDGVEVRLSDASVTPDDVTIRFISPDSNVLPADGSGLVFGWRLVEKPEQPRDDTYMAQVIVDPVDPEVIPVPGQFSLPFRIQGYPTSVISASNPEPVDAWRSLTEPGEGAPSFATISLDAPLPDGAVITLSLGESDAYDGIAAGFVTGKGEFGDSLPGELTLGPGEKEAYLQIDLPHAAMTANPDGSPRPDGTYSLNFTIEATGENVRLGDADPGEPVSLTVTQDVLVLPGGQASGCAAVDADPGASSATGQDGVVLPVCVVVAFNLGGTDAGVRAEQKLDLNLSSSAAVDVRIGDRDGTDVFPHASAGFAAPGGTYEDPALVESSSLDAGSDPLAVVLDVPAEDLLASEPGTYPVVIDVIVDPKGVELDMTGAENNGDGTWTIHSGAVVKVVARPVLDIGPVTPVPATPPEFVIGNPPVHPVTWKADVPYSVGEGVAGTLVRLDTSQLPDGVTAVLMGGMREKTEVSLDKPGLDIGVQAEGDPAALEKLGSGQLEFTAFLVIEPGNAEVTGDGVIDNGDGTVALPIPLRLTLIDPDVVQCELPSFGPFELADKGADETVTWPGAVSCAMPEGAVVRVGAEIGDGSPVKGAAIAEPRKLDVAVQDAAVTVSASANDLRAAGGDTVCLPVVIGFKLEGEGLILEGDGIQKTGVGMYAGSVEACAEISAAAVVRVDMPSCDVPALRSDADPEGDYRVVCTVNHDEENGGEAILTVARGGLSEGLDVRFVGGKESVTIREGKPDPLEIEITGKNEPMLADGASLDFELIIDPVDSVLEGAAGAWAIPARGVAGGIRAQTEPTADDKIVIEVSVDEVPILEAPTCSFAEPVWKDGMTSLSLTSDDDVPSPGFRATVNVDAAKGGTCTLRADIGGDLEVATVFGDTGSTVDVTGPASRDLQVTLPERIPTGTYEIPVTLTLDPGSGDTRANTTESAGAEDGNGLIVWTGTLQVTVSEATAHVKISGNGSATKKIEKYGKGEKPVDWPELTVTLDEKDAASGRSVLVEWTCTKFKETSVSPVCVGDQDGNHAVRLDKDRQTALIFFQAPEAALRELAEGEYAAELIIDLDSGGAALEIDGPKDVKQGGEHASITFEPKAKVYISFLHRYGRSLLYGLGGVAALALLAFARPGLPRNAAVEQGGNYSPISSGDMIGPGGAVDLGTSGMLGVLKGTWFSRLTGRAMFDPAQDVQVNGIEDIPAGTKVRLSPGDSVDVPGEGVTFSYVRAATDSYGGDGFADGNIFDGN